MPSLSMLPTVLLGNLLGRINTEPIRNIKHFAIPTNASHCFVRELIGGKYSQIRQEIPKPFAILTASHLSRADVSRSDMKLTVLLRNLMGANTARSDMKYQILLPSFPLLPTILLGNLSGADVSKSETDFHYFVRELIGGKHTHIRREIPEHFAIPTTASHCFC